MKNAKSILFVSSFILTTGATISLFAKANSAKPENLSEIRQRISTQLFHLPAEFTTDVERGDSPLKASHALFDRIDKIDALNPPSTEEASGVRAVRRVYNNSALEDSFTVVDRMQLPVELQNSTMPVHSSIARFRLGLQHSLDFANLRVLRPSDKLYREELLIEAFGERDLIARKSALERSAWLPMMHEQENVSLLHSLRGNASTAWSDVQGALRLPLKAEWLKTLDDGEIVTYTGAGTIEVGSSAGISYHLSGNADPKAAQALRTYLAGNFRISILKEEDRHVRVKVQRTGAPAMEPVSHRAYIVASSALSELNSIASVSDAIFPFRLPDEDALGRGLELIYHFDLQDDRAVEAYEQAALGRFSLADALAVAHQNRGPVQTNHAVGADAVPSLEAKIAFSENGSLLHPEYAVISLKDRTTQNVRARSKIQLEEDSAPRLHNGPATSFFSIDTKNHVIAEGLIGENHASGFELNRASSRVESLFGVDHLFPKVAVFSADSLVPTRVGRLEFSVRVALTPNQILKFAQIPKEQFWAHLEKGFDKADTVWSQAPGERAVAKACGWAFNTFGWFTPFTDVDARFGVRFWHADQFHDRWFALQEFVLERAKNGEVVFTEADREEFSRLVNALYSDSAFAYESIKTTVLALRSVGEHQVQYRISAQTAAFPGVEFAGHSLADLDRLSHRQARVSQHQPGPVSSDLSLEVSGLAFDLTEKDSFEWRFRAARRPEFVWVRLDEITEQNGVKFFSAVKRAVLENRGQFDAGENVIRLDRGDTSHFGTAITQAITPGKSYRLVVALMEGSKASLEATREFHADPSRLTELPVKLADLRREPPSWTQIPELKPEAAQAGIEEPRLEAKDSAEPPQSPELKAVHNSEPGAEPSPAPSASQLAGAEAAQPIDPELAKAEADARAYYEQQAALANGGQPLPSTPQMYPSQSAYDYPVYQDPNQAQAQAQAEAQAQAPDAVREPTAVHPDSVLANPHLLPRDRMFVNTNAPMPEQANRDSDQPQGN